MQHAYPHPDSHLVPEGQGTATCVKDNREYTGRYVRFRSIL
jgi:hypothetical protein